MMPRLVQEGTELVHEGELVGFVVPKPGNQPMLQDQRDAIARYIVHLSQAPELNKQVESIMLDGLINAYS